MNLWDTFTIVCLMAAAIIYAHLALAYFLPRVAFNKRKVELVLGLLSLVIAACIRWRGVIADTLNANPMRAWILLGISSTVLAILSYWRIYWKSYESFIGLSFRAKISDLISHVPQEDDSAWPHIFAGVFACFGICLLMGVLIASFLSDSQNVNVHGIAITSGGLVFAVLISAISFWTLCQTKRIEEMQGSVINTFPALIESITKEIKLVNADFRSHNFNAREYHRVLLVTTNPYFGLLSFPDSECTIQFVHAMQDAADNVKRSSQRNSDQKFTVEILCGNEQTINSFHQMFYNTSDPNDSRVKDATEATNEFLYDINHRARAGVIFQVNGMLKTQFAVVGNVVFEFILETPGLQTEIHQTRRIREKIVCDRFRDLFDLLKRLSNSGTNGDDPKTKETISQQSEGSATDQQAVKQVASPPIASSEASSHLKS